MFGIVTGIHHNFYQVPRFVELLVTGKFDQDGLRDAYVNQRGVALSKEGTDAEKARPLGITEAFTRLASSWLVRDNKDALAGSASKKFRLIFDRSVIIFEFLCATFELSSFRWVTV